MRERIGDFIGDESGQDLIEYALAAALIGLTSVAAMSATASNINAVFSAVGSEFSVAVGG
ncbi:MAG: Flp family type IVb pilin [Candidatus Korobacteraceae bacterium]